ncbi:ISC system 2Fe-2S type ferredoxin [Chitinimonas sp.]|uniref:ISC system 2Fe-2S type ferredoxin n=1 Tax=Chitinimonas sp. TaxID=1934313 RepID=UPI002F9435B4
MPKITVLPHAQLCPKGASFDVEPGVSICDALLDQHIDIEHACEKSCACTTCHVIVKQGFNSLAPSEEEEDDLLDKAWGLTSVSRLSCQALVAQADLTVEIPKYTINHAREHYDKDWDI